MLRLKRMVCFITGVFGLIMIIVAMVKFWLDLDHHVDIKLPISDDF